MRVRRFVGIFGDEFLCELEECGVILLLQIVLGDLQFDRLDVCAVGIILYIFLAQFEHDVALADFERADNRRHVEVFNALVVGVCFEHLPVRPEAFEVALGKHVVAGVARHEVGSIVFDGRHCRDVRFEGRNLRGKFLNGGAVRRHALGAFELFLRLFEEAFEVVYNGIAAKHHIVEYGGFAEFLLFHEVVAREQ